MEDKDAKRYHEIRELTRERLDGVKVEYLKNKLERKGEAITPEQIENIGDYVTDEEMFDIYDGVIFIDPKSEESD